MTLAKIYRVKVLDLKYRHQFEHVNLSYFIYEIESDCVEKAIKQARQKYMQGQNPLFTEELPFLLKLFSVDQKD